MLMFTPCLLCLLQPCKLEKKGRDLYGPWTWEACRGEGLGLKV